MPGDVVVRAAGRPVSGRPDLVAAVRGPAPAGPPRPPVRAERAHPHRHGRRSKAGDPQLLHVRTGDGLTVARWLNCPPSPGTRDHEPMTTTTSDDQLEALDRELLNAVQWDFPLEPRPFAVLGERLGITEAEVRERVAKVKELGVLRQLSAIFDTRALGYGSALVAAQDRPRPGRRGRRGDQRPPRASATTTSATTRYNLWYTIAVPPGESLDDHIDVLHRESGALVTRKLPTLKLYKIGVKLDMTGNTAAERQGRGARAREARAARAHGGARARPTSRSRPSASCRKTCRSSSDPFAAYGELIGCDEATVLELLRSFKERKLMRRFAAVMNHRSAGLQGQRDGRVGGARRPSSTRSARRWRASRSVSHCYRRPTYDDWPYSIFTMVHGKNAQRLRGDHRRDPRRDRRRRVRAAVVGQGVQEDPRALLHRRLGRLARRAPHADAADRADRSR